MDTLTTQAPEIQQFVSAMRRTVSGREMTNRVFRQVAGPSAAPAHLLSDVEVACYLLSQDWDFADVCKRES